MGDRSAVLRRLSDPPRRSRRVRPPVPGDDHPAPRWVGTERRRRAHQRALPVVLEEVARRLRTGVAVPVALAEVAAEGTDPVRAELRQATARLAAGAATTEALAWWRDHALDPVVALPVAALSLAGETGGSRAWAVDQVAATLRERLALQAELRAQASQATLSAAVLVAAPVAFAAVTAVVDPRVIAFLVGDRLGWACLLAGGLLDAAGAWWMARILRSAR